MGWKGLFPLKGIRNRGTVGLVIRDHICCEEGSRLEAQFLVNYLGHVKYLGDVLTATTSLE